MPEVCLKAKVGVLQNTEFRNPFQRQTHIQRWPCTIVVRIRRGGWCLLLSDHNKWYAKPAVPVVYRYLVLSAIRFDVSARQWPAGAYRTIMSRVLSTLKGSESTICGSSAGCGRTWRRMFMHSALPSSQLECAVAPDIYINSVSITQLWANSKSQYMACPR